MTNMANGFLPAVGGTWAIFFGLRRCRAQHVLTGDAKMLHSGGDGW